MKKWPTLSREFYGKCKCIQGIAPVTLVTYHGTQGPSARGGAATLTSRTDGSAHEVHDSKEGFKLAANDVILCGVAGANTGNYHIEDTTFASWTRKIWFLHKRTLKWSAYRIASVLLEEDLPCRFVGPREAAQAGTVARLKGWTYHCVLSSAPWCPSTHTDPAPNAGMGKSLFPHAWFSRYVKAYYDHPNLNGPIKVNRKGKVK